MTEPAKWPLQGSHASLGHAFDAAAEQFGGYEAYVDGDDRLTFSEWRRAADAVANEFVERGIGKGDVIGISLNASIAFAIATMAAIRIGAIATGLNPRLGPRELVSICETCSPALVIHESGNIPEGLPGSVATMSVDAVKTLWHSGAEVAPLPQTANSSDPAVIIWTSGTTGVPKGAWFDHDNLRAIAAAGGVISAPFDRRLSATPFAHAGFMGKLWDQLAWVSTNVLCPTPWSAVEMARLCRDESINFTGGAPTQWEKLLDVFESDGGALPTLRVGVVATAPAPPPLIERVQRLLGCTLVVRYAMTESPSISGTEPDDSPLTKARTVGRPQRGMSVRILNEAHQPCAVDEVGDVYVAGGCVMRGYWNAPELTSSVLGNEGWLRTNDTGFFDPSGNLVLVGRKSEMYIRGGYNVYPLEVENVLLEHPDVSEVAIVGAPAAVIGEVGVAFVVPVDPAAPPTSEELVEWVRTHLADYKAPDEIRFLDALPRTRMFKIDKEPLKAELLTHPPERRRKKAD